MKDKDYTIEDSTKFVRTDVDPNAAMMVNTDYIIKLAKKIEDQEFLDSLDKFEKKYFPQTPVFVKFIYHAGLKGTPDALEEYQGDIKKIILLESYHSCVENE